VRETVQMPIRSCALSPLEFTIIFNTFNGKQGVEVVFGATNKHPSCYWIVVRSGIVSRFLGSPRTYYWYIAVGPRSPERDRKARKGMLLRVILIQQTHLPCFLVQHHNKSSDIIV
jgi:hypothetical protein